MLRGLNLRQHSVITARAYRTVKIGNTSVWIASKEQAENPAVPRKYLETFKKNSSSKAFVSHLQWLAQKDSLGQDAFLVGPPAPLRRRLALSYCELAGRSVEVLTISQDTTESDLKQRREIIGGSALYIDQAPVRAALEGKVLILDGIEKAERNVLPTLNNLLENREMSLSDGTFLVSPSRYDYLVESGQTIEELTARGLKRVSPSFRVIALGLPVPEYPGFPIDPPLRSRFQGRYISAPPLNFHLENISKTIASTVGAPSSPLNTALNMFTFLKALSVLQHSGTIDTGGGLLDSPKVIPIPEMIAEHIKHFLTLFPEEQSSSVIIRRLYPFHLFNLDNAQYHALENMLDSFDPSLSAKSSLSNGHVTETEAMTDTVSEVTADADTGSVNSSSSSSSGMNYRFLEARSVTSIPSCTSTAHTMTLEVAFETNNVGSEGTPPPSPLLLSAVGGSHLPPKAVTITTGEGVGVGGSDSAGIKLVGAQWDVLTSMMQSHCLGHDICLVGEKGCGKSVLVDFFSDKLHYGTPELICCYKDMTSRDLLQRRRTDDAGNTRWHTSPLAAAALEGKLAVLDGVNRLTSDALSVISSLVKDREIHLPDGRRLLRHDRYDAIRQQKGCSEDEMAALDVLRIHPSFRIIAVGTPPERENPWLVAEVLSIFSFVDTLSVASLQDKISIISHISPPVSPMEKDLLSLLQNTCQNLETLAGNSGGGDGSSNNNNISPSCRQLLRLWRSSKSDMNRALPQCTLTAAHGNDLNWKNEIISDVNEKLLRMFMVPFMPASLRDSFQSSLTSHAVVMAEDANLFTPSSLEESVTSSRPETTTAKTRTRIEGEDEVVRGGEERGILGREGGGSRSTDSGMGTVQIGGNTLSVVAPLHPELVPDTRFVSIDKHMAYLENIGNDVLANERHILLIGNQGTGKNKLVDRFLHLMQWEREYMQLHRDTTVQSLTVTPTLKDGIISFEDSPIVKAVKYGRVLVLDEADKAPTEIVVVLKGLLEDGQLILQDGRKIVSPRHFAGEEMDTVSDENIILMHPDFRLFVLANRPGYPFLGNDFFREAGDCFSVHIIDNPPIESQLQLLQEYAEHGNVKLHMLHKLTAAFDDLRKLYEDGSLTYPYSMRELVGVIKHLDSYPGEGMSQALDNVLSWDGIGSGKRESRLSVGTDNATQLISSVLARHGISEYQKQTDGLVQHLSKSRDVALSTSFAADNQPISAELHASTPCTVRYTEQHTRNSSYLFGRRKEISARDVVATRAKVFSEEVQRWKLGVHEEGDNVPTPTPQSIAVTADKVIVSTRDPSTLQSYDITDLSQGTVVDTSNMLGSIATETDALPIVPSSSSSFGTFTNSVLVHALNGGFAHILHSDFANATKLELPEIFFGGRSSQTAAWLIASRMKQQGRMVQSGQVASLDGTAIACSQHDILMLQPSDGNSALARHITLPPSLNHPTILKSWALSKNNVLLLVSEDGGGSDSDSDSSRDGTSYMMLHSEDLPLTELQGSSETSLTSTAHVSPLSLSLSLSHLDDVVVSGAHILSNNAISIGEQKLSPGSVLLQTNRGVLVLDGLCDDSSSSSLDHDNGGGSDSSDHEIQKVKTYALNMGSNNTENHVLKTKYSTNTGGGKPLLATLYDSPPKVDILDISNMTLHSLDLAADWLGRNKLGLSPAANAESVMDHVVDIAIRRGGSVPMPTDIEDDSKDKPKSVPESEPVELLALHASGLVRTFQINDLHDLSSSIAAQEFSEMIGSGVTDPSVDFTDLNLDMQNSGIEIINDSNPEEVISLFGDSASGEYDPDSVAGDEFSIPGESGSGSNLTSDGKGGFSNALKEAMGHMTPDMHLRLEEEISKLTMIAKQTAAAVERAEEEEKKRSSGEGGSDGDGDDGGGVAKELVSHNAMKRYDALSMSVRSVTNQLRVVLEGAEAKEQERQWLRNQLAGDIDDQKLVDGITGDGRIYRLRGKPDKKAGMLQLKPKRLIFAVDCSASMARMTAWDGRLDRLASCVCMLMESLQGFEHKYDYSIVGHSGTSANVPLVAFGSPPRSKEQRALVVQRIFDHSRSTSSGDKSLEAAALASLAVTQEDADDYLVFLLSDANIGRYGISPAAINLALKGDGRSSGYCLFIAEPEAAAWLVKELPLGKAHAILDVETLPQAFKEIFSNAALE